MVALSNTTRLYIDNASPYLQMLGQVIADAKETTINDNGTEISNITLTDVKINEIQLTCTQNLDVMRDLLNNCTLELQYYDIPSSSYTGITLATFTEVNMQSAMVEFALNQNQLASFMENQPDKFFFDFHFDSYPVVPIEVEYRVTFRYAYSYDEKERKK